MRPLPRYAPLENVLLAMITEAVEGSLVSPDHHAITKVESAHIRERIARSESVLYGMKEMVVDQGVYDVDVRIQRTLLDGRGAVVGGDVNELTVTITPEDVWKRLMADSLAVTVDTLLPRWVEEYPPSKDATGS